MKRLATGIICSVCMLLLILDSKTALYGASEGVRLCMISVVPSLFPFFVLSMLLCASTVGSNSKILRPLGRLCKMPEGSESLLITGLLGGYPVGAQSVAAAYEQGQITKSDACRLLGFCSNAGPAFIFGMVGMSFPYKLMIWAVWLIHIASALIVGVLLPAKGSTGARISTKNGLTLSEALQRSVKIIAYVCGWIIIFRVITAFLQRWFLWLLPEYAATSVIGLLELANGCFELEMIRNIGLRFVVCCGMLGFGGICVAMQTVSVTKGLSTGLYFKGKVMQMIISIMLALCVQFALPTGERFAFFWPVIPILATILVFIRVFLEKKSSISAAVGV